jgi:DNA-binding PadR family transcriptional regulator
VRIGQLSKGSYNARQAAYDLRKLKEKGIVFRKENSRKYRITAKGVAMIVAIIIIREKLFKPIVAGITKEKIVQAPRNLSKIDQFYISIRDEIRDICNLYGMKGVIM